MATSLLAATDRVLRSVAFLGLGIMGVAVLVTLADIGLRGTFGQSIRGTVDVTQLGLMACAAWVIPLAFTRDAHVRVDIAVDRLPPRLRHGLDGFAALLGGLLIGAMLWAGSGTARQAMEYGDLSQTIGIPMGLYWAFFLSGMALALLACLVVLLRDGAVALGLIPTPQREAPL